MAKIEPWEQRIRDEMEKFAYQLNIAFSVAIHTHYGRKLDDPDNVPELDFNDTKKFIDQLVPRARKLLEIQSAIRTAIRAQEDGDQKAFSKATKPISVFVDGMTVRLQSYWSADEIRLSHEHISDEDERPFIAAVLVDWFFDYQMRYKDFVHLGACRQCNKVHVKPKHGQKTRYCSAACRQKAYRERKKESEVEET